MRNRNQKKTTKRFSAKLFDKFGNFDGVLRKLELVKRFEQYRKAAEQGDIQAQLHLGWCYANGEGPRQDYVKAVRWFRVVAEQGDARAQLNLGFCHVRGLGTALDYEEAAIWFLRAAEQGLAEAQNNIGALYMTGQGVYRDYARGLSWFYAAAGQGQRRAMHNLFLCYMMGIGVRQDDEEALWWSHKALEATKADRPRLEALFAQRRSGSFEILHITQVTPAKIESVKMLYQCRTPTPVTKRGSSNLVFLQKFDGFNIVSCEISIDTDKGSYVAYST